MPGEDDLDISLEGETTDEQEQHDEQAETLIAFADETEDGEDEDEAEPTPLVKRLRDQLREAQGQLAKVRRSPAPAANDGDPEPQVPEEPGDIVSFEYDEDKQREAWRKFNAATQSHTEWKARQKDREQERNRFAERQAKQIEQQRSSLGVADYEDRATLVRERLSDAQIAVLTNGAHNPAKLIYALGHSPSKLEQLAVEENLARFAVMIGSMERDIKVTKRNAPAADTRVRGATAPIAQVSADKQLEKLEKEAERNGGDRSKIIAYKRQLREAKAA